MAKKTRAKKLLKELFSKADIQINGKRPWDIKVHNDHFYRMWKFYLLGGAAKLHARQFHQWQIVLSKGDKTDRYVSIR